MNIDNATSASKQGFVIEKEQKTDLTHVEKLYDVCFGGASRNKRPIYKLRNNRLPLETLCFVIRQRDWQEAEQKEAAQKTEEQQQKNEGIQPPSRIIAALRFWNVRIVSTKLGSQAASRGEGEKPALLFGPLAVIASMQGKGFGKKLIDHGIEEARRLNYGGILISGVGAYYRPFGFSVACMGSIIMPRPSPGHVLMGLELKCNYLLSAHGEVLPMRQ